MSLLPLILTLLLHQAISFPSHFVKMREIIDGVAQIRLIQSFLFPSFDNAIPSLQQEYDRVSVSYDQLDGGPVAEAIGINDFRRKVGFLSKGNMLETAVGTGLQLPYYNWDKIERFTGVDLSEGMLRQANQKAQKIESFSSKINLVQGNVESLPFSDNQVLTAFIIYLEKFYL